MNLLEKAAANMLEKSGEKKKMSVSGWNSSNTWDVYKIPLDELYYNDKNGRINTAYKQFKAENNALNPEVGDSDYNKIFERFIYESNSSALNETKRSIEEKTQQEAGVVLPDGRVIDGNRRFTALRMIERETNIKRTFEAIILPLDYGKETDEKRIKELELELQLGREERVAYDAIDRIFDVYNTIVLEKIMTAEEYKRASGAGNTKGINRDIRLAELILKFINLVSPGDHPEDRFYLARELKLDGPIEEIESTINKLTDNNKEEITDAVLTTLAVAKTQDENADVTRVMRSLKNNVLKNDEVIDYFVEAVDDKVDDIIDTFIEHPIKTGNDLKEIMQSSPEMKNVSKSLMHSVNKLVYKGERNAKRREGLEELKDILDKLEELKSDDFKELTADEYSEAKEILQEIRDLAFKLSRG